MSDIYVTDILPVTLSSIQNYVVVTFIKMTWYHVIQAHHMTLNQEAWSVLLDNNQKLFTYFIVRFCF